MLKSAVPLLFRCTMACLLMAGTLSFSLTASAEQVDHLYRLSALVSDTGEATRQAAARDMLARLLVRVSGTERTLERDGLETRLDEAERWVTQFRYESTNALIKNANGAQTLAQRLTLEFDPAGVTSILRDLKAPIWGDNRPAVLIWAALEGKQGRYLISDETNPALQKVLQREAHERGLPMVVPGSGKPRPALSDVWGQFADQVQRSSSSYHPDAVVLARIQPRSGGGWQGRWTLATGMDQIVFTPSGQNIGQVLRTGVDMVTEALADRYAARSVDTQQGPFKMLVSGVTTLEDYAQFEQYLTSLAMVDRLNIERVNGGRLLVSVNLRGQADQLKANLKLDGRLKREPFLSLSRNESSQTSTRYSVVGDGDGTSGGASAPVAVDAYVQWQH
ncbi:hypothetical protein BFW38_08590 [Terasakiispira papahanaumokuakeensis]|uniref:DUF2066 domain-containing protein n=1 Tax=Terasakiispira papahanaumokuakeensis TaxID=197479 RepID=A0A1E2V9Q6_9GAMM|nr:DUF2066 domain-containing protein [Terasakiispira papahanaumokuakeensis]ODC03592.1 hypothetical protein BFW38_08590 [Terasakiispira papahanaumokuakeensis]